MRALSWQPTLFLDDQMWLPYVQEIRKRRLYDGFGTWRHSLATAGNTVRRSVSRRFKDVQADRHAGRKQQTGNARRRRDANDRRADLLNVARGLWPQVLAESSSQEGRRGRPPLRDHLAERLRARGRVLRSRPEVGDATARQATRSAVIMEWLRKPGVVWRPGRVKGFLVQSSNSTSTTATVSKNAIFIGTFRLDSGPKERRGEVCYSSVL